jgi:hypothetical protein
VTNLQPNDSPPDAWKAIRKSSRKPIENAGAGFCSPGPTGTRHPKNHRVMLHLHVLSCQSHVNASGFCNVVMDSGIVLLRKRKNFRFREP